MTRYPKIKIVLAFTILALAALACALGFNRNEDGSINLKTEIKEATIQGLVETAISDPLIQSLTVDLRDGYIFVSGDRKREDSDAVDRMSFRVDLGVSSGHLTATISEAQLDGFPMAEKLLTTWNERIADRLESVGQQSENSALQSVSVNEDAVTLVWRVELPGGE